MTGRRYRSSDGVYDMHPADAAAYKRIGAFSPNLAGANPGVGYACVDCGFGSFFTTCSRCGGVCRKES